ncbi:MAG: hypothetical protein ACE5G6_02060 [Terriglobia bacterium]
MRRRLVATLWLLLLATSHAAPLAGWVATQECRCDERVCRCHDHHQPAVPKCHFPNGGQLPAFQSCDSDDAPVMTSAPYLLPEPVFLARLVQAAELPPAALPRVPLSFEDISPPPPRAPLA